MFQEYRDFACLPGDNINKNGLVLRYTTFCHFCKNINFVLFLKGFKFDRIYYLHINLSRDCV